MYYLINPRTGRGAERQRAHNVAHTYGGRMPRRNSKGRFVKRSYGRNPPLLSGGVGGVIGTIKRGVRDGLVILVSQVGTKKAITVIGGFNPIKGMAGTAITGLGTAVGVTMAARKLTPNFAALVSAAAFAEALRLVLAASPVGPYLADYTADGSMGDDEFGAWAGSGLGDGEDGMGAWAMPDQQSPVLVS